MLAAVSINKLAIGPIDDAEPVHTVSQVRHVDSHGLRVALAECQWCIDIKAIAITVGFAFSLKNPDADDVFVVVLAIVLYPNSINFQFLDLNHLNFQ